LLPTWALTRSTFNGFITQGLMSHFEQLNEGLATLKLHEAFVTNDLSISNTADICSKIEPVLHQVNELDLKLSELSNLHNDQMKELQAMKTAVVNHDQPPAS